MAYPAIDTLSTPPNRSMSAAVFESTADQFLSELPTFGTQQNTLGSWMEGTAATVESNTASASNSAVVSAASANMKGRWVDLSGVLNIPASVSHDDKMWILLENLADVTTEEPGISTKWQQLMPLGSSLFTVVSVSTNYTAVDRQWVEVTAGGVAITLPTTPIAGMLIVVAVGAFKTTTVLSGSDTATINKENALVQFFYTGTVWRYF